MLYYEVKDITKLETYLSDNGYELNSDKISVYHNPICYYYKNNLAVLFQQNDNITIKDYSNNRKYEFDLSSSQEIIVNFLSYLEKSLTLV